MTKTERETIKAAAEIMTRELREHGIVRIPGFGRIRARRTLAYPEPPTSEWYDSSPLVSVPIVRFKPWKALKAALGGQKPLCRKPIEHVFGGTCCRPEDHNDECSHHP